MSWKGFDSKWLSQHENQNRRPLRHAQPERHQAPALDRAIPGEKKSLPRVVVRIVGYRVRLLDCDNFAGSTKDIIDGLRHACLLRDDSPEAIELVTTQERVRHFCEERTEIEIDYPCDTSAH